jgi:hypothetical protein
MISGQAYRHFVFGFTWRQLPNEFISYCGYLWRNFLGTGILIGIPGLFWLWRSKRDEVIGYLILFTTNALFFINYAVSDKDTMFLPGFVIWTILIAGGLLAVEDLLSKVFPVEQLSTMRLVTHTVVVSIAIIALLLNWNWVDMSKVTGPSQFAQVVLDITEPNASVLADWSSAVILEYYQIVGGQRKDLTIINRSRFFVARFYELLSDGLPREIIPIRIAQEEIKLVHDFIKQQPAYSVEYNTALIDEFEFIPVGNIYQLLPPSIEK